MKTGTTLFAAASLMAAAASYGANITLQGTEVQTSFNIADPASWGVEAINPDDYATITTNGTIPTEAYIDSNQTFQPLVLHLQNNAHLVANGSGSTIKNVLGEEEAYRSNTNFGTNNGSNVSVEILGSGNTYSIDVTGRSFMMGDVNATHGANKIYVSSSDSSKRNYFGISGVNIFLRMNSSAESTASNTISIGDNSDAEFTGNTCIGGSEGLDMAGGRATLEMVGDNSMVRFYRDSTIGNNAGNGSQSGGSAKVLVSGSNNTFNSVGTTVWINKVMTGGSNSFEISGEYNTVSWQNIQVGNASSTGGTAKVSVQGSTHNVSASDQLGVYGAEVVDDEGNVVGVNGGTLEFIADDYAVSIINVGRVVAFDGILSLDFSDVVIGKGEYAEFCLITASNDWSVIAEKLLATSDSENAHVNVKTKSDEDIWEIIYNGGSLYFAYTYVPEPSTYAAIFGLGALIFALARRRKN